MREGGSHAGFSSVRAKYPPTVWGPNSWPLLPSLHNEAITVHLAGVGISRPVKVLMRAQTHPEQQKGSTVLQVSSCTCYCSSSWSTDSPGVSTEGSI